MEIEKVSVNMPLNVAANEDYLFRPYMTFSLKTERIKYFKNVFVTYTGLCANNKGLIPSCHHDYPDQYNEYLAEAQYYYTIANENENELITLNNDITYLLIHHPWFNYYHWLMECIFRIWLVRDKKDKFVLLLPEYYAKVDFITGSLEAFGFQNVFLIPANKSLYINKLCIPPIKAVVDSYNSKSMSAVSKFLRRFVKNEKNIDINLGDKLYISRSKAKRKKIINEADMEPILSLYGFTTIHCEDYSFQEQVAIFSNAKYLVSMHGSGLTNMLFMSKGSLILELHKRITNEQDWHSFAFWYQADCLGHFYYHQLCEPADYSANYFFADYHVDLQLLKVNLELMLNKGCDD